MFYEVRVDCKREGVATLDREEIPQDREKYFLTLNLYFESRPTIHTSNICLTETKMWESRLSRSFIYM